MPEDRLTFDRFLVGGPNELAARAARKVAESPGTSYNPLLIHGRSGVGKSHLLRAVAAYLGTNSPEMFVQLESAGGIADRLTSALAEGDAGRFAESFVPVDFLLIDEVDRFEGMERTQAELRAVIERMLAEGRQLVLASAVPPAEFSRFSPDLLALLTRGLVVEIDAPDAAMARGVAADAAREHGVALPAGLLDAVAARGFADVRSIREAVNAVILAAARKGREADEEDLTGLPGDVRAGGREDEFDSFLDDVSRTLATVVETAPWRRRIAEAILRWEGEGVRTTRLEEALHADTPPDVDGFLAAFAHDAERLVAIRRELSSMGIETRINDPVSLASAEAQLTSALAARESLGRDGDEPDASPPAIVDGWFLNPDKLVLDWVDVEGRLHAEMS